MKKILGIGNALVDVLMRIEDDQVLEKLSLPKGTMQLIDQDAAVDIENFTTKFKKQIASGGSAANTINGLARLGVECGYIGKIGDDIFGQMFKENLEANRITTNLFAGDLDTGRAYTFISQDGERTFGTFLGSAVQLGADDLTPELFRGYDYLHVEGYLVFNHELIETALSMAKSTGLTISTDLASFNVVEANLDFLKKIIADYVDIVFANEEEARSFTGESPEKALDAIAEMSEIAVVKVGEKGSLIKSNGQISVADSILANCLDTTGAGDLYASGFLYGLVNGYPLATCGKIGSILGGNVIEIIGAVMDEIRWNKIHQQIKVVIP